MRYLHILIFIICGGVLLQAAPLVYNGSTPENNSVISSFNDITLHFDIDAIVEEFGEGNWGVCCMANYNSRKPAQAKCATLYKGSQTDDEVIERLTTTRNVASDDFVEGGDFHLSFPDVQVETGQLYTLVLTYDMYAGRKGVDSSWLVDTKLALLEAPIIISFIGGSEVAHILNMESSSIDSTKEYEQLNDVSIEFNYPIVITESAKVELMEDNIVLASAEEILVDSENEYIVKIGFKGTSLYKNHTYQLVVSSGSICIRGEENVVNNEVVVDIKGASYQHFGLGRGLMPSDGSISILDEIVVPFNLPKSATTTYGFKESDEGLCIIEVYSGDSVEGPMLMKVKGEASTDGNSVLIRPNYAFEPSSDYTFLIPEGALQIWDFGGLNPKLMQEYISDRIELHYSTPSVEELSKWNPAPMNVKNDEEISELKYFILDCPEYEYDDTKYDIVFNKNYEGKRKDAALYKVTDTGEEELVVFNVTLKTLDANSEIGNGELDGRYFVGEVNQTLYEGIQYKLVWFANKFIVNNPFIGKYIGNPEISVSLKGATPTADDFGLKANIDDRLHSHADVFSFITESEVKAGEGATMKLMDGEENVAEAPVYVSREANGHRVYADFGGKKLESGKSYDVVLPEGSVYATNGIVNNPEIKSALTAMPETPAAPEFISIALNIDEYASATYRMVKGQESVLDLKAGDNWKLDTLTLDGEDVTADVAENGLYTLPVLDKAATLDATYAYAHEIDYDYETGVGSIEDLPYSLSKDGSHLMISGLNGGENIAIYTVGGMKIAGLPTVPTDMTKASLELPEGQVYIVLINGVSIKWKH